MSTSHYEKNGGVEGNTPGNCAVRNCAVEHTHLIFTREGNGRIWPSAIPYWVQWCRKSIWRSPKLHSHPCGSPNFLHMCIVYSPNDINHAVCTQFFFLFLHFIFTKMELLTHEAKIKGKHLASLELFLQSSIKIPLSGKKCLQLLYNSWTLISDLTARLSSWCSSRPQACTSCETISVVEVLVDLVVVLQVLESLERLFGFSTMKRCFDLLGISLAMDFEMKSEELSFLKLKHNSSSCHGRLLTTLKIILILNWSIQFSGWIPAVSVQSDPLYCKHMHSISSADQRAQVHHHRKKIIGSVYISMHING